MPSVEISEDVLAHAGRLSHLLINKENLEAVEHADCVKTPCLTHQASWLAWAKNFKACGNFCEQGTGKSKMALDWLDMKGVELALMICRNSNVLKWASECRKHSDYKPYLLKGTRNERAEILREAINAFRKGDTVLVIINYEYAHPFLSTLSRVNWGAIVLDESTAVKSTASKRHKAICRLGEETKYKLILTGTPLVNSPIDAFGQFKFLNPHILGSNFYGFKNRYVIFGGYNGYQILGFKNTKELQDKIETFSFRVLKKNCLDLPPKIFERLNVPTSAKFQKDYRALVESAILEIGGAQIDNTLAITRINRCLQFCDGFLYDPNGQAIRHGSPKDDELISFLEDHFLSKNKVVVWAYFRETIIRVAELIQQNFPRMDVRWGRGQTPVKERSAMVNWLNGSYAKDDRQRCLVLQSTAFMHGIDLLCDTAVYFSRSWSNEEWLQTQDRIHGINRGGGESTNYILLTVRGTVEESVHVALRRKEGIAAYLLRDVDKLASFLKGLIRGVDDE
jgi:SNF2 family DNA or RNA helicase